MFKVYLKTNAPNNDRSYLPLRRIYPAVKKDKRISQKSCLFFCETCKGTY